MTLGWWVRAREKEECGSEEWPWVAKTDVSNRIFLKTGGVKRCNIKWYVVSCGLV